MTKPPVDDKPKDPVPAHALIDRVLSRPSTECAQPMPPQKLPDRLLERLWLKMAEMFGHRWTASFGVSADPSSAWASTLKGLDGRQLAHGLNVVAARGEEWPPSAPAFRAMCLNAAPETMGLPGLEEAFLQALAGTARHPVVKAGAKATGTFDLRRGAPSDAALRRRFEANYLIAVRRWGNGEPLEDVLPVMLGHDSQKTAAELAEEHAERQMRERLEHQGLANATGAQARQQLLASLRIRRPEASA